MENSLQHHGIKGQRWGVRRFQNKDGTLTSRGKLRKRGSKSSKSDKPVASKPKSVKEMTDDEIRGHIARLKLEKEYTDLLSNNKREISNGQKFAKAAVKIFEESAQNIGKQYATYVLGTAVNKLHGGKEVVNPKKGQKDK